MIARFTNAALILLTLYMSLLAVTSHPARSQLIPSACHPSACHATASIDEAGNMGFYTVYNLTSPPAHLVSSSRGVYSIAAAELI